VADDGGQVHGMEQGDKQKQAPDAGTEGAGRQIQLAHIGAAAVSGLRVAGRSSSRRRGRRAKPSSRIRTAKALMLTEWPGGGQFALDIVDGEVSFAHGHRQGTDPVTHRGRLRPVAGSLKKPARLRDHGGTDGRGRAKPRASRRSGGDFRSWALLDEVSAERFVLALEGASGARKNWASGLVVSAL